VKFLVNGSGARFYEAINAEIEANDLEEAIGIAQMDFFHDLAYWIEDEFQDLEVTPAEDED
jgi:hypothetical protein